MGRITALASKARSRKPHGIYTSYRKEEIVAPSGASAKKPRYISRLWSQSGKRLLFSATKCTFSSRKPQTTKQLKIYISVVFEPRILFSKRKTKAFLFAVLPNPLGTCIRFLPNSRNHAHIRVRQAQKTQNLAFSHFM